MNGPHSPVLPKLPRSAAMPSIRSTLITGAAVLAAVGGAATLANAASSTGSSAAGDQHGPHTVNGRSEQTLTGATAGSVRKAALAKVPGTVERVETNVDGSAPYEAHITKAD